RRHRRSRDRLRQRGPDRAVGHASRRAGLAVGAENFPRRRYGAPKPHGGISRKTRRYGGRRPYRRKLRSGDERGCCARITRNYRSSDSMPKAEVLGYAISAAWHPRSHTDLSHIWLREQFCAVAAGRDAIVKLCTASRYRPRRENRPCGQIIGPSQESGMTRLGLPPQTPKKKPP